MRIKILLTVIVLTTGLGLPAAGEETGQASSELKAVSMEYEMAKTSRSYFVLDIANKKLSLKVKGMTLKSWPISAVKFWGRPSFPSSVELVKKSALKTPQRFKIPPGDPEKNDGETETDEFQLDALELADMPRWFSLYFDAGCRISVRAKPRGLGSRLVGIGEFLDWHALVPVKNLFYSLIGKPLAAIEITIEEKRDAQAIYWCFFEGLRGLIL